MLYLFLDFFLLTRGFLDFRVGFLIFLCNFLDFLLGFLLFLRVNLRFLPPVVERVSIDLSTESIIKSPPGERSPIDDLVSGGCPHPLQTQFFCSSDQTQLPCSEELSELEGEPGAAVSVFVMDWTGVDGASGDELLG